MATSGSTATPLSEIVFVGQYYDNNNNYSSTSQLFRDYAPTTAFQNGSLAATTMVPFNNSASDESIMASTVAAVATTFISSSNIVSPFQSGYHCLNLIQRPPTLAIHRNIAAWIAVTLAAIGVFGNIFSLFVLFRTQPRSPTDVYMMHLAAYDVAYEIFFAIVIASRTWWAVKTRSSFTFVFISLVCRPLIDLFSNLATIVVTVFAMERLLAVYRPLKILNTSANKRVLWIALAISTLITLPDFFEFGMTAVTVDTHIYSTVSPTTISVSVLGDNNATTLLAIPFSTLNLLNNGSGHQELTSSNYQYSYPMNGNDSSLAGSTMYDETVLYEEEIIFTSPGTSGVISPSLMPFFDNSSSATRTVLTTPAAPYQVYCYYRTDFAQSTFYNAYVYFYTVVFTFIPLLLLVFANVFLIRGVAVASQNRKTLTKGQHQLQPLGGSQQRSFNTQNSSSGNVNTNNQPVQRPSLQGGLLEKPQPVLRPTRSVAIANNGREPSPEVSSVVPCSDETSNNNKIVRSGTNVASSYSIASKASSKSHQQHDQHRLTLMLVMIVLIFTVCQLPIAILAIYSLLNEQMMGHFGVLVIYSNILVIVFSTTNFAFYSAFSRRFRHTLNEMIGRLKSTARKKLKKYGIISYQPSHVTIGPTVSSAGTTTIGRRRSDFSDHASKTALSPIHHNGEETKPMLGHLATVGTNTSGVGGSEEKSPLAECEETDFFSPIDAASPAKRPTSPDEGLLINVPNTSPTKIPTVKEEENV